MAKKKHPPKPNKAYELPALLPGLKLKHKILAFDPGSRNMGISCVGVDHRDRIHVIANSIMQFPIASLVDNYMTNRKAFLTEINRWHTAYEPDLMIAERYQTRGIGGPLIELVGDMNAVIGMSNQSIPFKRITAATWKNAWHRRFTTLLEHMYKLSRTQPHPLDATLIGVFGLELALQRDLKFGPRSMVRQVEATSCLPLKRERKQGA